MDIKVFLFHMAIVGTCMAMSYDHFHAYKVGPLENAEQIRILDLLRSSEGQSRKIQILEEDMSEGKSVDLIVSPDQMAAVEAALSSAKMTFSIVDEDVQKRIDKQRERNEQLRLQFPGDASTHYMDWEEQLEHVRSLAENSDIVEYSSFGTSIEGRSIPLISINGDRADLPGIWIDAGIHSREWLAHATAIYIAEKIIFGKAKKAKHLRRKYRFYIAPNLNPDGYVYSWTEDRYWRKNRNTNADSECVGTDLNRNFATNFAYCGVSADPCSDLYPGSGPASELETRAVVNEVKRVKNTMGGLDMYINMHSYGQLWLIPWAGNETKPADYKELKRVARKAVKAIHAVHRHTFVAGTAPDLIYCAAGGALDWAKNDGNLPGDGAGIKYSYTPEIRPKLGCCANPFDGFSPDPSKIKRSGQEMFAGIYAAVTAMK